MIDESLLGRYHCTSNGSNKYWHIIYDKTRKEYKAQWGAIGARPQTKVYTQAEALKKIKEKRSPRKGYYKVDGYQTVVGANSTHFILAEDDVA